MASSQWFYSWWPFNGVQKERLEQFYGPQAKSYDRFRERLQQGRKELIHDLAVHPESHVVELDCGTGRNLAYFGDRIHDFDCVTLVNLCPSLLAHA